VPSRKQRRRRQKSRRHEYEYVYIDEDGQEVEVEPEEVRKPARSADHAARPRGGRGGRKIEPPSWTRVAKRGLIFAPLMFLTVSFLAKNISVAQRVYQTVFLLAFFLPFSYLMDSIMYRSYLRRTGAAPPASRRGRGRD
jgi:hypothetical protein